MKITAEQLEELTNLDTASDVAAALRSMGIDTDDPPPDVRSTMPMDDMMRAVLAQGAPARRAMIEAATRNNPLLERFRVKR